MARLSSGGRQGQGQLLECPDLVVLDSQQRVAGLGDLSEHGVLLVGYLLPEVCVPGLWGLSLEELGLVHLGDGCLVVDHLWHTSVGAFRAAPLAGKKGAITQVPL